MGFKLAELFVSVSADTSKYTSTMVGAKGLAGSVTSSLKRLAATARGVFLVAAGAMGGFLAVTASYEKSMARIQAITSATKDEFTYLDDVIRTLGIDTIYSAKEVADAGKYLAVAGYSVTEIGEALPAVMDLAAAGVMNVADAADYAVRTMKGMGIPVKDLRSAVDMMTKAFTSANTDLHQFSEALSYVGPIARFSEYSLNEVGAAIMVVSNAGIQAERAGTGLRRFFAELSRQASPTKTAMKNLGVQCMDTVGNLRALPAIIDDLSEAMERNIPVGQRLGALIDLFGLRAGPAVAAMLSTGSRGLIRFEELLRNAGGTARNVAEIQMQTLWGRMRQLKNAIFETGITIGTVLQPTIEVLIRSFRGLHIWLRGLPQSMKVAIGAAFALTAAFSGLTFGILKVASLLSLLAANPITAVVVAIGILATRFAYVRAEGETLVEKLNSMWETVYPHLSALVSVFTSAFSAIWNKVRGFVAWFIDCLPKGVDDVVEYVTPMMLGLFETIKVVFNAIVNVVARAAGFIRKTVAPTWRWTAENVRILLGNIQRVVILTFARITFVIKNWSAVWAYVFTYVRFKVVEFVNAVKYYIGQKLWIIVRDSFYNLLNLTETVFTNLARNIGAFFKAIWRVAIGETKHWEFVWTPLRDGFTKIMSELPDMSERPLGAYETYLKYQLASMGRSLGKEWKEHWAEFLGIVFPEPELVPPLLTVPKPPEIPTGIELGKRGITFGKFAGDEIARALRGAPAFVGIEEMSRRLQAAVIKRSAVLEQQLSELKQIQKNTSKLETQPEWSPLVGP